MYIIYEVPELSPTVVSTECNVTDTLSHCGNCGKCSTVQDYNTYVDSQYTFSEIARDCAFEDFFGDSHSCFTRAGLTEECATCWVDNVKCDRKHCVFPCLVATVLDLDPNTGSSLSKCFACDEYYCGKEFIGCAGMNRRRAGIETDIYRNSIEICNL